MTATSDDGGGATRDVVVVGAGIVGLSAASALTKRLEGIDLVVLEKEDRVASHQSGRNSGVVHSGLYYAPGSLKARYCTRGRVDLEAFAREHDIPIRITGKVVVATREEELPRMETLRGRGLANGLDVRRIGPDELRSIEPHAAGIAALLVPETGIVDYGAVARALAGGVAARGGEVRLGTAVTSVREEAGSLLVETSTGAVRTRFLVNCAGLYSDRLARLCGVDPGVRIVPFRGEYYALVPERRSLVRRPIYPVPDPSFPFLGVHLTPGIDGSVHAGPNAVLALGREAYERTDVDASEALEALTYPGFLRLAARHWRAGMAEVARSLSKRRFTRSLQRLVPAIRTRDLEPAPAGIRAQALSRKGDLVDDFLLLDGPRSLHVCNAPSPAATACLPIGRTIAERVARSVTSERHLIST